MIFRWPLRLVPLAGFAVLLVGCNPGAAPLPEGPRSFVGGERLTLEGTLRYWPSGQTGTLYNLSANASANGLYRTAIGATGAFALTAGPPPAGALSDFGPCQKQLDIQPAGTKIFSLNFAVSKKTDSGETFAGYAVESYNGSRERKSGFSEIVYFYNGGSGTWIKGTCSRDDDFGSYHTHWEATYENVYLYPGWNALVSHTDVYAQDNTHQDEHHTLHVATDELGYAWAFQDFYRP